MVEVVRFDKSKERNPSLLFAGDTLLSEYFSEDPVHPTIKDQIAHSNYSNLNLEGPIALNEPIRKWGPIKAQSQTSLKTIQESGFESVALANNHTMDQGAKGLETTIEICSEIGLDTVGAGSNIQESIVPLHTSIQGNNIAIFNLCEREFGGATDNNPGTAWIRQPGIERKIEKAARSKDIVLVTAHGGAEYIPIPPQSWQAKLRSFVDAGADAIICHHPHVAQGWEVYRDAPIFYSLGNFAFRIGSRPATAWSFIVDIEINEGKIESAVIRLIETTDGKVQPMIERDLDKHWNYLLQLSEITRRSPTEPGYWQEVAQRSFESSHERHLRGYGLGHITSLFQNPKHEINRLTKGIVSNDELHKDKSIALLNYIQNESHRDIMKTVLELQTGVVQDQRTDAIREEINQLYKWTDERGEKSVAEKYANYIKTIHSRLR